MNKSQPMGFCSIKTLSSNKISLRRPWANRRGNIRRNDRRDQTKLDLGKAEAGMLRSKRDITTRYQPDSASDRCPLYHGNRWLGHIGQCLHQVSQTDSIIQVLLKGVLGHTSHPVKVGTGRKTFATSSESDNANVGISP